VGKRYRGLDFIEKRDGFRFLPSKVFYQNFTKQTKQTRQTKQTKMTPYHPELGTLNLELGTINLESRHSMAALNLELGTLNAASGS